MNTPFPGAGLAPNLVPNPPPPMPEAPGAGDAMAILSPFAEPQDTAAIIAQLKLDKPLSLYIPDRHLYPNHEFRFINSIPQEMTQAHNKGFRQVSQPELASQFDKLHAGRDKDGAAFRPLLFAREKVVGEHIAQRNRTLLRSTYAGMDPRNKDLAALSRYAGNVDKQAGTFGDFSGNPLRIKIK